MFIFKQSFDSQIYSYPQNAYLLNLSQMQFIINDYIFLNAVIKNSHLHKIKRFQFYSFMYFKHKSDFLLIIDFVNLS